MLIWKRTLRTASSERFLAQREGKDVVAVDLSANFPAVGQSIRAPLPLSCPVECEALFHWGQIFRISAFPLFLDHGNLNYTVVIGEVLGNFEAEKKPE